MIFRSHLLTMAIFSAITSFLLALIKHDDRKEVIRYTIKIFIFMCGGVIVFSWVMKIL